MSQQSGYWRNRTARMTMDVEQLISLMFCVTIGIASATITCDDVKGSNPDHTLCLPDNVNLLKAGLSEADKAIALDMHNNLRGAVEPPATNLAKVVWDDNLAAVAQKWANQCAVGHDSVNNRYVPEIGRAVGQNMAAGQSKISGAIQAWYDEIDKFVYGGDVSYTIVGHFTQMLQDGLVMIGCGYAECSVGYNKYYVCNYVGANFKISKPYKTGTRCSDCMAGRCVSGVCDCNGLKCINGGSLDISTCKCSCGSSYSGDSCETLCNGLVCNNGGELKQSTCQCKCPVGYSGVSCDTYTPTTTPAVVNGEVASNQCYQGGETSDTYSGTFAQTMGGYTCQKWGEQSPHSHRFSSLSDSQNYCRNPDGEPFPWCYTTDPNKRWQFCYITRCSATWNADDCYAFNSRPSTYSGRKSVTMSGKTCQNWNSQTPHAHSMTGGSYPEGSADAAQNYCRDPDNSGIPWCYTTDENTRWEYCDIAKCLNTK